jgi:hypothetical protein
VGTSKRGYELTTKIVKRGEIKNENGSNESTQKNTNTSRNKNRSSTIQVMKNEYLQKKREEPKTIKEKFLNLTNNNNITYNCPQGQSIKPIVTVKKKKRRAKLKHHRKSIIEIKKVDNIK